MKLITIFIKDSPKHFKMKDGKSEFNYIFVKLLDLKTKNFKAPLMNKVHTPMGLFGSHW